MSLHPTGTDVAQNASAGGHNVMAVGVHALAIAAIPVLLSGMLVLTMRLARSRDFAWLAFIVYSLASVAVMIAAVASGLIVTDLAHSYVSAEAAMRETLHAQMHLVGTINQAFAKVFVMFSSVAIMLWSIAMLRISTFGTALAALGIVAGVAMMLGVASGHLQLNIHGFGAVMLAQGIWMCWTGAVLMRVPDDAAL